MYNMAQGKQDSKFRFWKCDTNSLILMHHTRYFSTALLAASKINVSYLKVAPFLSALLSQNLLRFCKSAKRNRSGWIKHVQAQNQDLFRIAVHLICTRCERLAFNHFILFFTNFPMRTNEKILQEKTTRNTKFAVGFSDIDQRGAQNITECIKREANIW